MTDQTGAAEKHAFRFDAVVMETAYAGHPLALAELTLVIDDAGLTLSRAVEPSQAGAAPESSPPSGAAPESLPPVAPGPESSPPVAPGPGAGLGERRCWRAGWSEVVGLHVDGPTPGAVTVPLSGVVAGWPRRWHVPISGLSPADGVALQQALESRWGQVPQLPCQAGALSPSLVRPPMGPPVASPYPGSPSVWVPAAAPFAGYPVRPLLPRSGWWMPTAPPATPRPASPVKRTRRRWRRALGIAVSVVAISLAIALPLALVPSTPAVHSSRTGDPAEVAGRLNLVRADLPADWVIDRSPQGPLHSFLSHGSAPLSPSAARETQRISAAFEQCMGVTARQDRVFGSNASRPTADVTSPAFAAPGSGGRGGGGANGPNGSNGASLEVGSDGTTFRSAGAVAADVAFFDRPAFDRCFGVAFGSLLTIGSQGNGGGAAIGTPRVQSLTLPQIPGAAATGVVATIPLSVTGASTNVSFGTVLVGGGKAESTLIFYGVPTAFPTMLTDDLTTVLEQNILRYGTDSGT